MQTERGFTAAILDRLAARTLGFPPEICTYTVTGTRIPVSNPPEPFELAADLYQPVLANGKEPAGTILIRCPYGRGLLFALLSARPYAARGYQCLLVSCRGTFGSGGEFHPWHNEEEDGQAVIKWMRHQSWYTGSFATLGGSYLGFVQFSILRNPPPDMVAAVIQCAPHDFSKQLWGTGSLALEWISWAENVAHQEETGIIHTVKSWSTPRRMRSVLDRVPLAASVKKHFAGRASWMDYVVDHPDISDAFYDDLKLGEALERANLPIFLVGGWYDVFAPQTMEQFERLIERNMNVALLMGPWNHMQVGLQSKVYQRSFDWLEQHLGNRNRRETQSVVEYFVTGAEEWRHAQIWPPPTLAMEFHLQSGDRLVSERSNTAQGSSDFAVDLDRPTPTVGGNLLLGGGSADDTALAHRSDIITFTTDALEDDIEIAGKVVVHLSHSCDNPNKDLFVRISDVNTKGRSHSITETYKRLPIDQRVESYQLSLNDCAHRFLKTHRIRLIIAGASYPQFATNTEQTGSAAMEEFKRVTHTVHYGHTTGSKVVLPVFKRFQALP